MAYHAGSRRVILHGGGIYTTSTFYSDLWTWDGTTWAQFQAPNAPSILDGRKAVYDSRNDKIVLFAQNDPSVWEWTPAGWTEKKPSVTPGPRAFGAAYDQARGVCVTYGSTNLPYAYETWEWDGSAWQQRHPQHQPQLNRTIHPQLQYVPALGGVITFDETLTETWLWDGVDWRKLPIPVRTGNDPANIFRFRRRSTTPATSGWSATTG